MYMQEKNRRISRHTMEEENELIAIAVDDPRQFEILYSRYFLQIFKYIFNRVRQEHDAAALTSDVFAKALCSLNKYQFRQVPFVSWLYGIARNELLQHFRKNKKEVLVFLEEEQLRNFSEELEGDNKEVLFEQMKTALEQLSVEEIELVEMKFFQQQSHREIAVLLNISEENTRVRTFRVIKKLKETVNKMNGK